MLGSDDVDDAYAKHVATVTLAYIVAGGVVAWNIVAFCMFILVTHISQKKNASYTPECITATLRYYFDFFLYFLYIL